MSAHTPGPWSIETVPTSCGICHKVGPFPGKRPDGKPRHACLYADYPSKSNPADDELAANARLIAAAPELLHAAKRAEAFIAGFDDENKADDVAGMLRDLRAAIAKATGSAA